MSYTKFVSSSKSASQQAKNKGIWVQKGSSTCCVASEDFTNSTTINVAQGDLEKPFSEHPPNYPSTSSFASSKSTNQQPKTKCIWVRKGASPHCLATEDHKNPINIKIIPELLERPFSPSSPESSSSSSVKSPPSPKSPPIPDVSKKKPLRTEALNILVKKDDSLYDFAHDFKDANIKSTEPSDFIKYSSSVAPTLDSSSPLTSPERHLTSPECASFYKKPTVSVSFNSATQQTKNKSLWVQKSASSRCVGSEDFTNLTSIDTVQGDLEKPISEEFHKSDLSLSSFGTTPHPPKHLPISDNPTSSFSRSKPSSQQTKPKCIWVEKGASSRSLASEGSENLAKINIVPGLIEKSSPPLSPVSYPSSYETPPSSPRSPPIFKPTLSSDSPCTQQNKSKSIWVEKGALPRYIVPEDFKNLIKRDLVPEILKKPLSPLTYKDYFAALLYAEDCYIEKWDGFEMEDVSMEVNVKLKNVFLELHRAEMHRKNGESKNYYRSDDKDNRTFVQFELDSIPERRPFLLSKDFAYVRPSGTEDTYKGIVYRVVKRNHLLVEFGKDFYEQHHSDCKYDVRFSLNRVCLKRAHKAVEAASDEVFRNFLFPNSIPRSNHVFLEEIHPFHIRRNREQACAAHGIVMHQSPTPYLVEGPLSGIRVRRRGLISETILTTTANVIQDAVVQLLRTSPLNRILICAPSNSTCDALMRNLQKEIPVSDMFRSNAAFRGLDEVPDDIIPHCPYEEEKELFPCPPLAELEKFRLILSTFMSTFRLHHEGLKAGHFSHIFLVDASSAIEPETLVPLSNLANEKTVIVVTGKPGDCSRWVRSPIARENGLRRSYFERLRNSELYGTLDPQVKSQLSMAGWT
ncbi:putative RNA helicase SDE3 [Heracleum sosnowskyi]|uniref:RNA helicase SDE3 n=1 Tax=Heracleum sosnowskyi TaxID=360622 RepID=A0AAD8IH11_9APIA|nr:putative RNA helicase SDE3 [Heracleum sosnowskyi]